MPKKRQIRFLNDKRLTDGTLAYYWEPSATRKKQGFDSVALGTDQAAACRAAIELNAKLDAWLAGGAPAATKTVAPPRVIRFDGLVQRYKAHDAYRTLKPASRDSYDTALRILSIWAEDGQLPITKITDEMVHDLRDVLVQGSSAYRASSILRVLRMILGWAKKQRLIATNSAAECNIPTPPSRDTVIPYRAVMALVSTAADMGHADMALLIELAFWTAQRQSDMAGLSAIMWREHHNIDPRDAAVIAGPDGRCMAFRLQQQKTGAWVDVFAPPHLHAAINDRLRTAQPLFPDYYAATKNEQKQALRRLSQLWKSVSAKALTNAAAANNVTLTADLTGIQFRDLRRSGLTFYADGGAESLELTNVSGHAVLGKKSILDTYIKTQPIRSAACLAKGLRHAARLHNAMDHNLIG